MDLSLVVAADPVSAAATPALGFSRSAPTTNHLSAVHRISAAIFGSIARPPVKPNSSKAVRSKLKRKRRVRKSKKSDDDDSAAGDSGDGDDCALNGDSGGEKGGVWIFGDSGGGGGFYGGGGGGGRGWSGGGFGGYGWGDDEFSWSSDSSLSGVWFREVFVPIVIAACLHFSMGRVLAIMEDGVGDAGREKVRPLC